MENSQTEHGISPATRHPTEVSCLVEDASDVSDLSSKIHVFDDIHRANPAHTDPCAYARIQRV